LTPSLAISKPDDSCHFWLLLSRFPPSVSP
jgi:hypothetical protein